MGARSSSLSSSSSPSSSSSSSSSSSAAHGSDAASRVARAAKLGHLDLSHLPSLERLPPGAAELLPSLRRLDVSHTAFTRLPIEGAAAVAAKRLDFLSASACRLEGAQPSLHALPALTQLLLDDNTGLQAEHLAPPFRLPASLKALSLARCARLGAVPRCLLGSEGLALLRLERLDLTGCGLRALPAALAALGASLTDLLLDDNALSSLALVSDGEPSSASSLATWASFGRLAALSARRCRLSPTAEALPEALFAETRLASLSLGGNALLSAATVLALPGVPLFEARRAARINKGMAGDVQENQDRSFCGIDRR